MNDVLLMKPQTSISLARKGAPLKCMQVTNALSFLAKEKFLDHGICWYLRTIFSVSDDWGNNYMSLHTDAPLRYYLGLLINVRMGLKCMKMANEVLYFIHKRKVL